jgi:hypothetical protein
MAFDYCNCPLTAASGKCKTIHNQFTVKSLTPQQELGSQFFSISFEGALQLGPPPS